MTLRDRCWAIVSVFETGRLPSPEAYSTCTLLTDGAGVSYGLHQATDRSGSLDAVCAEYVAAGGPRAAELAPWLEVLADNRTVQGTLPTSDLARLTSLLRELGRDPVMRAAQDAVFARMYWDPTVDLWHSLALLEPLSLAVLYDTAIHSGPAGIGTIRRLFPQVPPSKSGNEHAWTTAYVAARRAWLASRSNQLVQRTVYRMDAFQALIAAGSWTLATPFSVRGVIVGNPTTAGAAHVDRRP